MHISKYTKLVISLVTPQLAGLIGSVFTMPAISHWYAFLEKPVLVPPNSVFAPVWTTLYLLMGIAVFLVWQAKSKARDLRFAWLIFGLQLVVNVFWSVAFFGMQDPLLGLMVIGSLWILIVVNIFAFAKISRLAAALLLPYLAWVSFASYLNYGIWLLN